MNITLKVLLSVCVFSASLSPAMAASELHSDGASAQESSSFSSASFYQTIRADQASLAKRITALSATLLGAPYVGGSLGEGASALYDKDPLTRFGEFDCTTYIETVFAGAMARSPEDFLTTLKALRYKNGEVSFVTRNHFPSLDWVPNNQDKFDDMTAFVAGGSVQTATTNIDKSAWYHKVGRSVLACKEGSEYCESLIARFAKEGEAFKPEIAHLEYVPLTALYLENGDINQALLDRIPTGSLINMVRPNWDLEKWIGTKMNVSHQGLAIRKEGKLYLRHASVVYKKVIDEPFYDYFSRYTLSSSLKGFNVQTLKSQAF